MGRHPIAAVVAWIESMCTCSVHFVADARHVDTRVDRRTYRNVHCRNSKFGDQWDPKDLGMNRLKMSAESLSEIARAGSRSSHRRRPDSMNGSTGDRCFGCTGRSMTIDRKVRRGINRVQRRAAVAGAGLRASWKSVFKRCSLYAMCRHGRSANNVGSYTMRCRCRYDVAERFGSARDHASKGFVSIFLSWMKETPDDDRATQTNAACRIAVDSDCE